LSMTASGLIFGTPTNLAVDSSVEFEVVDTSCDEANPRIFIPRASLSTVALTRIATVIGYDDFGGTIPPKKYKRVDYSGAAFQGILDSATDTLRYSEHDEFSGFSEIDINGTVLSSHQKNVQGRIGDTSQAWYSRGDKATNSSGDATGFLRDAQFSSSPDIFHRDVVSPEGELDSVPPPLIADPVYPAGSPLIGKIPINSLEEIATQFSFPPEAFAIYPTIPRIVINTYLAPWINFSVIFDYHVVVSNEYTDAEALSVAQTLFNSSNIARNEPRTFGYTSRFTTVGYSVYLTNLVVGQVYNVIVPFHLSNGANLQTVHTFIAAFTTHSISGIAPTPPPYITLEVRPPTVVFV